MIISRTPVRISFFGGGTDMRDFYSSSYGAVLSTAIKKYIYVAINKKFDEKIRVSYSETEIADALNDIKHGIIRECLRSRGVDKQIEVVTIADIPGHGSGLGSSSALTVGTLNALNVYVNRKQEVGRLAEEACGIEIEALKKPIGKQDQYIAALGGFRYIRFNPDESVTTEPVTVPASKMKELQGNLISFYIPGSREGDEILRDQKKNMVDRMQILRELRDQAGIGKELLIKGDLASFGRMLDKAWQLKSQLSNKISTPAISSSYEKGISAGALGGKLSGAGGSGFLTFYCDRSHQEKVRASLSDLKEMKIEFEPEGSRIVYQDNNQV